MRIPDCVPYYNLCREEESTERNTKWLDEYGYWRDVVQERFYVVFPEGHPLEAFYDVMIVNREYVEDGVYSPDSYEECCQFANALAIETYGHGYGWILIHEDSHLWYIETEGTTLDDIHHLEHISQGHKHPDFSPITDFPDDVDEFNKLCGRIYHRGRLL